MHPSPKSVKTPFDINKHLASSITTQGHGWFDKNETPKAVAASVKLSINGQMHSALPAAHYS